MNKHAIAVLAGAAFILPLSLSISAPASAAEDQVRLCIRHVAEMERTIARQTEGDQRREILRVLDKAKRSCTQGNIGAAYQAAGKGLEKVNKAAKKG